MRTDDGTEAQLPPGGVLASMVFRVPVTSARTEPSAA